MVVIETVSSIQTNEKEGKTYKTVSIEDFSLLATDVDPLPSKDTFIKAIVSNYWPKGKKPMFSPRFGQVLGRFLTVLLFYPLCCCWVTEMVLAGTAVSQTKVV